MIKKKCLNFFSFHRLKNWKWSIAYTLSIVSLFFYSFTQVDLNLTLTKISLWFGIQDFFQHIGFFNRPFSTFWYIVTGMVFISSYIMLFNENVVAKYVQPYVWTIVFLSFILYLSYPAFSYDIYNYMFDAKIVTKYHENPYIHKALDYPDDPWILFMHWTHRTYPYGPFWLFITVPLSFIGMQKFLVTLYLFKLLMYASYLVAGFSIYRIAKLLSYRAPSFYSFLFLFSPFVLVEGVVSSHNDIVMMALVLLSYVKLIEKKNILSFILFFLSLLIKYATIFLLPLYFLVWYIQYKLKKNPNWQAIFFYSILFMCGAIFAASFRTTFQPWYLFYLLPFIILIEKKQFGKWLSVLIAGIGWIFYIPYLYTGAWEDPIPLLLSILSYGGLAVGIFLIIYMTLRFKISVFHITAL